MNTAVANPAARPPRWRRVLKWTLRTIVAVIVLAIIAWTAADYLAARELNREVEKIRAAGEPTTFEALARRRPQVAEAEDAARFYGAALLLQEDVERMEQMSAWIRGAWLKPIPMTQKEVMQATQEILDHNSLALQMVDRGAALPACAMDMGMQYGVNAAIAKFGPARNLARLTSLRTQFFARQGQAEQAVAAATAAFALHRMYQVQPTLLVHLTGMGSLGVWTEDVPVILEHAPVSDSGLVRLYEAMQTAEQDIDLRKVGLAERVYALEVMRNLVSQPRDLQPRTASIPSQETWTGMGGPVWRRMATGVLRKYATFIASTNQDWPALVSQTRKTASPTPSRFSGDLMAAMLTTPFDNVVVLAAHGVAYLRSARTAVLVERYHLAQGRWPSNLSEVAAALQIAIPKDPFTGQDLPLLYRTTDDGYLVYSVGRAGKDLGGQGFDTENGNVGVRVRTAGRPTGTQ